MYDYPITIHHEHDHYWSSCPDIPEAHSAGETLKALLNNAVEGMCLALSIYVDQGRAIPPASVPKQHQQVIHLPAQTVAKIELWNTLCEHCWRVADLARLLGISHPVASRLVDFSHNSKLEQLENALKKLGKRLVVQVKQAA